VAYTLADEIKIINRGSPSVGLLLHDLYRLQRILPSNSWAFLFEHQTTFCATTNLTQYVEDLTISDTVR